MPADPFWLVVILVGLAVGLPAAIVYTVFREKASLSRGPDG
jgi:hypothetical protein